MDAILFSANPSIVNVDDAIRHLRTHEQLYWEVGFRIRSEEFDYPILGLMHVSGSQIEYKATIEDIVPFSPAQYENRTLANRVKPRAWLKEWRDNEGGVRSLPWKHALVMTEIVHFSWDTLSIYKHDGTRVRRPPQGYMRVLAPGAGVERMAAQVRTRRAARRSVAEQNLEDFTVDRLERIEPGLRLEHRQLSTPAGRLDLLCRDANGNYVVVELKRGLGTDQVVGQVLRYMGWLADTHGADKVRGIVIVSRKDEALTYALKAVPNVTVKEFKVSFS